MDSAPANDGTATAVTAALPPEQRDELVAFLDELERWNHRLNLTAVPAAERWQRHVVESLQLAAAAGIAPGSRVIDVGSGAGLPGVVIAVTRRDVGVTLLEADRRRSGFLTHVAGVLGLRSVAIVNRRAEEAGHDAALRERFDLAVSRATAPAPVLCELALPFVRVGGRLTALVGDAERAARACADAARLCGGDVPEAAAALLVVAKAAPTPERFPRRPGLPARRPLTRG